MLCVQRKKWGNCHRSFYSSFLFPSRPVFCTVCQKFLSFDTQEACYEDRTYLDIGSTEKTFGKYRSLSCYSGLQDMCGTWHAMYFTENNRDGSKALVVK